MNTNQPITERLLPPRITKKVLIITTWLLWWVGALSFVARIIIRKRLIGQFYFDDVLAGFSLTLLLTNAIIVTIMAPSLYETLRMVSFAASLGISKRASVDDPLHLKMISFYMKLQFCSIMLFWASLWVVKATFLAVFSRLTNGEKKFIRAWWCIAVATVLGYAACVISYPLACSSFKPFDCQNTRSVRLTNVSLRLSTAMDITTDLMIIGFPMAIAWRLRLPFRAKAALFGIFALGGIIMVFAVARVIITSNTMGLRPELSWLNLWSAIESSIAVVVGNLVAFKTLFRSRRRARRQESFRYPNGYEAKMFSEQLSGSNHSRLYAGGSKKGRLSGKRGFHTQVTSIPLAERQTSCLGHGKGEIVITREVEKVERAADELSSDGDEVPERLKKQTLGRARRPSGSSVDRILPPLQPYRTDWSS